MFSWADKDISPTAERLATRLLINDQTPVPMFVRALAASFYFLSIVAS
jgi:hypothetical protein